MASTRNVYTALTPEFADFAIPHTPVPTKPTSRWTAPDVDNAHEFDSHEALEHGRLQTLWSSSKRLIKNNTGILLVASSQAFFAFMNVGVKKLNGIDPPVSTFELIVVRMGITAVCAITYMLLMGIPDPVLGPKGVRSLLVFRGFIGFFGLFGIYYSLQYLSLSDATVLTFLAPMCTIFAGSVFLGETFTYREVLAGFVSLFGVVLIARPAFLFGDMHTDVNVEKGTPRDRLIAVGVALIGVIGATGAYTSIRAIGKRAHPLHSLNFFSILCVVAATVGMIVTKTTFIVPNRWEWLAMLLMIGVFGFIAQFLLALGLQRETAGRGSMGVYSQVIFATILEKIFFKAVPTLLSVFGTLLIITSAIYVALTKESASTKVSTKSIHLQQLSNEDAALEEGLLTSATTNSDESEDNQEYPHLPRRNRDPDKADLHVRFDTEVAEEHK